VRQQRVVSITPNINDDLDDYLRRRRGKSGWRLFGPVARQPAKLPASKPTITQEEPGFWKRLFGAPRKEEMIDEDLTPDEKARLEKMEQKIEKLDEAEHEHPEAAPQLEREKESLVKRFFNLFRGYERRHQLDKRMGQLEVYEAEVAAKDEEVKRVLKQIHGWLERLPPDEKEAFRRSSAFHDYKALLEKYGLLREKTAAEPKPRQPVRNVP
jgi:hypothetical protein